MSITQWVAIAILATMWGTVFVYESTQVGVRYALRDFSICSAALLVVSAAGYLLTGGK